MERKAALYIGAVYMVISAYSDWKNRTIDTRYTLVFGTIGMVIQAGNEASLLNIGNSMLPGILTILLSLMSGGGLGMGDGIFLFVIGLITGKGMLLFVGGLMLCGLYSLLLFVRAAWSGQNVRGRSLPMVVFMFPIYFWILIMEIGGMG